MLPEVEFNGVMTLETTACGLAAVLKECYTIYDLPLQVPWQRNIKLSIVFSEGV